MNAIVCNTLTGAVSEYTRHTFQSVTPTHAGSASGLYAFGGDTDASPARFEVPGSVPQTGGASNHRPATFMPSGSERCPSQ